MDRALIPSNQRILLEGKSLNIQHYFNESLTLKAISIK